MRSFLHIVTAFGIVMLLTNCVAIQPFPNAVRAGDTVTLAIGSLDNITARNINALYYSDSDVQNPVDITSSVRSVLRIYPDKTSKSYWDTSTNNGLYTMDFLSRVSSHGPWQTVIVLDLPVTLPGGTGYIKITPDSEVRYPLIAGRVENIDIAMEILTESDGTTLIGGAHQFKYKTASYDAFPSTGLLGNLQPLTQLVLRHVPDSSKTYPIAAAEYIINLSVSDLNSNDVTSQVSSDDIVIVLDDMPTYVKNQVSLNWSKTGNDIKILILSSGGTLNANSLRFSILLSNLSLESTNGWSISDLSSLVSSRFYDISGDEVTGSIGRLKVFRN